MKNPLVSVIIATYNRENSIKRAIESVFMQTYENIELIVVDDGSIDKTKEIIKPHFQDKRFIYIYQTNKGASVARNKGIEYSKGKYIAILDSDDFWCDFQKLEKQVVFLEKNNDYILTGGGTIKINDKGEDVLKYLLPENDTDIRKVILFNNPIANVTALYRKDAWEKVGGYNKELDGFEDWELWLKMGKLGKFYNFQDFFSRHSGHGNKNLSYVDKTHGKIKQLKLNIKLKVKYRHDYVGYRKAILLCWASYFYYLLPFRNKLWPLLIRLRVLIFGNLPYRYLDVKNKQS